MLPPLRCLPSLRAFLSLAILLAFSACADPSEPDPSKESRKTFERILLTNASAVDFLMVGLTLDNPGMKSRDYG